MQDILDRQDIETLVNAFYKRVLDDTRINYFFTEVAKLDFEIHLPKMYNFWESTILHTGSYVGNTLLVHKNLHQKSPLLSEHFEIWLMLFTQTIDDHFVGINAELAKQRAASIAMIMQLRMNDKKENLL